MFLMDKLTWRGWHAVSPLTSSYSGEGRPGGSGRVYVLLLRCVPGVINVSLSSVKGARFHLRNAYIPLWFHVLFAHNDKRVAIDTVRGAEGGRLYFLSI